MRTWALALALAAVGAGPARAAPWLQIRGAALRIAVVPEARRDIRIDVLQTNPRLPLRIHTARDRILVVGDVSRRVRSCAGSSSVDFWGRGRIPVRELPWLVVRTPRDVRLTAGDAVYGVVGRSASLDLTNQGCGRWTVADVAGHMRVDQAGAGVTRTGGARGADLSVAGSGYLGVGAIAGPVMAVSSGSGDIGVARIAGRADVRVAGTGAITLAAGEAPRMTASIAGSGRVRMLGQVGDLSATVTGSGMIEAPHVRGRVQRRVFGAGVVRTGP